MEIRRYVSRLLASNMYVIVEGKRAIIVDPFEDTSLANGLVVDRIILTHEHYDHISGVNAWKEIISAPVLCSKACAENIRSPKKNLANYFNEFCELQTWIELEEKPTAEINYSCEADETFEDSTRFSWQGHEFFLFEIPGHSLGSIGIMMDGTHFFSGDSLMEHSDIELRMPGGSRKKWKEIGAPRIAMIPDGTRVYPGHFQDFVCRKEREN